MTLKRITLFLECAGRNTETKMMKIQDNKEIIAYAYLGLSLPSLYDRDTDCYVSYKLTDEQISCIIDNKVISGKNNTAKSISEDYFNGVSKVYYKSSKWTNKPVSVLHITK